MGSVARANRAALAKFNRYWEDLIEEFPAARAAAMAKAGQAVKGELDIQITTRGVDDMFGHIRNTQRVRLGSLGGYAAITPTAQPMTDRYGKTKTWNGKSVSTRQVTRWLEKGHGTPSGSVARSVKYSNTKRHSALVTSKDTAVVRARMFYSFTKGKAFDITLKAANEALEEISERL